MRARPVSAAASGPERPEYKAPGAMSTAWGGYTCGAGRTWTGASMLMSRMAVIEPAAMIEASTTIWNRPCLQR